MRLIIIALAVLGLATAVAQAAASDDTNAPVARCTSPAPTRTGKVVTEKPLVDTLEKITVAGIAATSIHASQDPDPVWCLESTSTVGGEAIRVFRNIGTEGAFTPIQRVSVGEHPSRDFYVMLSGPAFMMVITQGDAAHGLWRPHVLYQRHDHEAAVYAMFDGEPDTATTIAMVTDILSGKIPPAFVCALRKVGNGWQC